MYVTLKKNLNLIFFKRSRNNAEIFAFLQKRIEEIFSFKIQSASRYACFKTDRDG